MIFAHPSEKLFSDHLDLFDIEWIYEPVSFPLEWGSGSIKKMFTPDFYLPSLDLFVEITTMNKNLITRKRKKLKLAKKLYPEIKFKLLNEQDFYNILSKNESEIIQKAVAS